MFVEKSKSFPQKIVENFVENVENFLLLAFLGQTSQENGGENPHFDIKMWKTLWKTYGKFKYAVFCRDVIKR